MKKLLAALSLALVVAGCGGAVSGDAAADSEALDVPITGNERIDEFPLATAEQAAENAKLASCQMVATAWGRSETAFGDAVEHCDATASSLHVLVRLYRGPWLMAQKKVTCTNKANCGVTVAVVDPHPAKKEVWCAQALIPGVGIVWDQKCATF